jgi:hypothetical protein
VQVLVVAALAWVSASVLIVSLGAAAARGDRQPSRRPQRRRPIASVHTITERDRAARLARIDRAARHRRAG